VHLLSTYSSDTSLLAYFRNILDLDLIIIHVLSLGLFCSIVIFNYLLLKYIFPYFCVYLTL
jgi:hypothetical protein